MRRKMNCYFSRKEAEEVEFRILRDYRTSNINNDNVSDIVGNRYDLLVSSVL